ncbi:hypothetical protein AZE42_07329 [Rhizopogon vesiculosus]|uniref:Uncharacterized protein n=1 Tax=Rhizopogon vesiculosus TaxID=180088 RepID=A0A1J8PXK5_9AGAM|nr:hypothetical protein AZE42_07329 [Rhizopogon vesiculosus]
MTDHEMDSESSSSSRDPSPSSSPAFEPVDSSPLSSPQHEPYMLDSSPPTRLDFAHPFAASAKANKRPPQREKKIATPPTTPPSLVSVQASGLYRGIGYSRSLGEDEYLYGDTSSLFSPESPAHRAARYIDREERLWEEAVRKPFDTGNGHIDLRCHISRLMVLSHLTRLSLRHVSNQQLKTIPPSITDLADFFNTTQLSEQSLFPGPRNLSRVNTEPDFQSRARSFERTKSIIDSGKERHMLQLYLFGNSISFLPPELFTLRNLTVLSLRGNLLTYIPPEICRLINLKELNISQNRLSYLPSEMRDMTLSVLMLYPNPFLQEPSFSRGPSASRDILSQRRSITRIYSQRKEAEANSSRTTTISPLTIFLSPVPPLTEICLRKLLCPLQGPSPETVLSEYYGIPLPDVWDVPENLHDLLADNVPGLFKSGVRFEPRMRGRRPSQGMGMCANPDHVGSFFVRHAAERFTWERRIAGVDVGGTVPLRWRGCMQSCLGFLDEHVREANKIEVPSMDVSDEMNVDLDLDEGEAVQTVDLGGGLSMDDFDN